MENLYALGSSNTNGPQDVTLKNKTARSRCLAQNFLHMLLSSGPAQDVVSPGRRPIDGPM